MSGYIFTTVTPELLLAASSVLLAHVPEWPGSMLINVDCRVFWDPNASCPSHLRFHADIIQSVLDRCIRVEQNIQLLPGIKPKWDEKWQHIDYDKWFVSNVAEPLRQALQQGSVEIESLFAERVLRTEDLRSVNQPSCSPLADLSSSRSHSLRRSRTVWHPRPRTAAEAPAPEGGRAPKNSNQVKPNFDLTAAARELPKVEWDNILQDANFTNMFLAQRASALEDLDNLFPGFKAANTTFVSKWKTFTLRLSIFRAQAAASNKEVANAIAKAAVVPSFFAVTAGSFSH